MLPNRWSGIRSRRAQRAGDLKRLVIGRAMRSEELGETLLPKRFALPIFASDPLSSVAYATQEILLVLTLGGLAYLHFTPWITVAVVALMTVVVLSYRQVVHAYPSGGGGHPWAGALCDAWKNQARVPPCRGN